MTDTRGSDMNSEKAKSLPHHLTNCQFYGVKFDGMAIEALANISEAIKINAQAALALTDVFKAQNIQIDAMIKIEGQAYDGQRTNK